GAVRREWYAANAALALAHRSGQRDGAGCVRRRDDRAHGQRGAAFLSAASWEPLDVSQKDISLNRMNTRSWLAWLAAALVVTGLSNNPLYLLLMLLAATLVFLACHGESGLARAYRLF